MLTVSYKYMVLEARKHATPCATILNDSGGFKVM